MSRHSRPISIDEMVKVFKSRHATTYLLKIDNYNLLKKYHIERVESSVFVLGGHEWKLIVYPNGTKNAHGYVSIFLENQASINVKLEYQVFVVSQLEQKWHPTDGRETFDVTSTMKKRGHQKLISLADLEANGYLIGDCCMFGVKLFGIEPPTPGKAECFSLIEKPPNHKVTWMITKYSSFDPERVHHSNEFVVGTRKWRLEIHPRGDKDEENSSFSVYLSEEGFIKNAPKTKTFAKFKVRVLDQVNRDHEEETYTVWFDVDPDDDDKTGFWYSDPDELDEPYLVKDKLYVGVEFEVISITKYC